jgi:hypothetical protein
MENLRHFLLPFNKSEPIWFGSRIKFQNLTNGYMHGGGGIVLSGETLERIVLQVQV